MFSRIRNSRRPKNHIVIRHEGKVRIVIPRDEPGLFREIIELVKGNDAGPPDVGGYGSGFKKWGEFYIGEDMPNAAQYMSPFLVTKNIKLINRYHVNLCGQIATSAALGLTLPQGLNLFANISDYGPRILNNPKRGTYASELVKMFEAAGRDSRWQRNDQGINSRTRLTSLLLEGLIVIALVNIDGSRGGRLRGAKESGRKIPHWVWVRDASHDDADKWFVDVYNPYMNRFEEYEWETFEAAHRTTPPNDSLYLSVIAAGR